MHPRDASNVYKSPSQIYISGQIDSTWTRDSSGVQHLLDKHKPLQGEKVFCSTYSMTRLKESSSDIGSNMDEHGSRCESLN